MLTAKWENTEMVIGSINESAGDASLDAGMVDTGGETW